MKKISLIAILGLSAFVFNTASAQQIGDLDTSFNTTGKVITDFSAGSEGATGVAIQADGKIVAVGYNAQGTVYTYAIARYNVNGALDTTFGVTGKIITDFAPGYDFAATVAIQPDGKIVAAGNKATGNTYDNSLVRYNTNGSLDTSFGNGGKVSNSVGFTDAGIVSIKIQPDGKIVAAGIASDMNFGRDFGVTRYNSDGSLDLTFGTGGKVLIDFALSSDFPYALALQADGKIVVGGMTGLNSVNDFGMVRLDTLGAVDISFGTNGIVVTDFGKPDEWATGMVIQPDGKIVMCGNSGSPYKFAMARYNDDGALDTTFNSTGTVLTAITTHDDANAIALQTDGKIVLSGVSWNGTNRDFSIVRYNTDGSLDSTFSGNGSTVTDFGNNTEKATGVAIQTDGKIVAVGNTGNDFAMARYIVTFSSGLIDFETMDASVLIYPNPVTENATLSYTLNQAEKISIRLYDVNGKLVSTVLDNEFKTADTHQQEIRFSDDMAHGTYFVVISNGKQKVSIQVVK